jgi:tRNA A-37 threonylcarbamoyl transferase component Bud32
MLKTLEYVCYFMKEIIEIKRKEFEVIEKIGDRSYKVERKGKVYFLKKFENDIKGFQAVIKNQEILRNSGYTMPKVYMWDKNANIFVTDYIDGVNVFDILCKEDLSEKILEGVFMMSWYAKKSRNYIDFDPINFKFADDKLYYLPFKMVDYDSKRDFLVKDLPYWFFTKDFVKLAHSRQVEVDTSRLLGDFEMNKKMTLIAIKYYR